MRLNIEQRTYIDDSHLLQIKHPKLRQIYASRGIESDQQLDKSARSLLHYTELSGIQNAVEILAEALKNNKKIIIIGDFDADGATSTALVSLALASLGGKNHDYLVPNRFDFGYGLSPEIVAVAFQHNAEVIITVDNGIACLAGVKKAKEMGTTCQLKLYQ
jgi:single-stranded-DNA-specific exonuclease